MNYRIYLDVCCLNRPLDDWSQKRIRLEAEAILDILEQIKSNDWILINSETIEIELSKIKNFDKLTSLMRLLDLSTDYIKIDTNIMIRSEDLEKLGFDFYDSLHIACAETARADVLLTTDDRLLRKAIQYEKMLTVRLNNPVIWLMKQLQSEGETNNDTN